MCICAIKVFFRQILAEVDDAVEQDSTTDRALASRTVVMGWTLVGCSGVEICEYRTGSAACVTQKSRACGHTTDVFLAAVLAVLAVAVPVELRNHTLDRSAKIVLAAQGLKGRLRATGKIPLLLCRPSQFWLMTYLRMPRF